MSTLQCLREARAIVRWMLVCFTLSIGVAVASPLINPQGLDLVCSATGSVKLVGPAAKADSNNPLQTHALNCVMCLPSGAPPVSAVQALGRPDLAQVLAEARPATAVWRLADPTSARDPPSVI